MVRDPRTVSPYPLSPGWLFHYHRMSPLDLSLSLFFFPCFFLFFPFTSPRYFNIRDEKWNPTQPVLYFYTAPSLSWNIHDDFVLSVEKKERSWADNKRKATRQVQRIGERVTNKERTRKNAWDCETKLCTSSCLLLKFQINILFTYYNLISRDTILDLDSRS